MDDLKRPKSKQLKITGTSTNIGQHTETPSLVI